jgi:hypothetical protein
MKLYGEYLAPKANIILPSRTLSLKGGIYAKTVMLEPDAFVVGSTDGNLTDTLRVTVQGVSGLPFVLEQHVTGGHSSKRDKLRIKPPGGVWQEKILASASPNLVWQIWDLRMLPVAKGRGFRWLHDAGSGLQSALSGTGILGGDSLKSVTLEYIAQPARMNRQISLDDIHLGCLNPTCPSLTVQSQPIDTVVWQGGDARFEIKMTASSLGYQWYANGVLMPNETASQLNVRDLIPSQNEYRYKCRIRSNCDSIWSREAVLTVRACGNVALWSQPKSQRVREGGKASFNVNAGGIGVFQYAWYRNGLTVEGAGLDTFRINPVQLSDHCSVFQVKVSDGCGQFELSDTASLTVLADSTCHILSIQGPDTLHSGRMGAYEIQGRCPAGTLRYSLDNQAWQPVSRGGVAVIGPFALDSNTSVIHTLKISATNLYGNDSLVKSIVVVAGKPYSQTLAVSGRLKNLNGASQDGLFAFEAQLYDREGGGRRIYRESFSENLVPVLEGQFTLSLGTGQGCDSLAMVLRKHPHAFLDIQAGRYGVLEPIVEKLPLTAAPIVLRLQP